MTCAVLAASSNFEPWTAHNYAPQAQQGWAAQVKNSAQKNRHSCPCLPGLTSTTKAAFCMTGITLLQVLTTERDNAKALFRRGKAFQLAKQTESALKDLEAARRLRPYDSAVKKELQVSLHSCFAQPSLLVQPIKYLHRSRCQMLVPRLEGQSRRHYKLLCLQRALLYA